MPERVTHAERENKNKSETECGVRARESQGKEQKYLVLFLLPFLFGYFVGGKRSTYRLRFVAVATKQNSKANEALRKLFFFIVAILQWPHTIHEIYMHINSMYTYTH